MVDGRSLQNRRFWTDKKILDDAKKHNRRQEWSRTPAGMAAQRFGIYKEAVKHMPKYKKKL